MVRVLVVASLLAVACSDAKPAKKTKLAPVTLTPGPVPVTLANIDAKRLRPITSVKEFVILDAKGAISWGQPTAGSTPWAGEPANRRHDRTGFLEYDLDSYGVLSRETTATVVIVADAATPARLTLRDGIQAYGYKPVALAAGEANTAVPYQFGGEPWREWHEHADVTVRTDNLDALVGKKPRTVLLQFTDATTTGELLTALATVAETGAEHVRLHRMMGWGAIGPSDIVWVHGAVADDDEITPGDPAKVTIGEIKVDGQIKADSIDTAMQSASPRFRYCYEKSGITKPGKLELAFDVAADGSLANAAAKGLDRAIESCVAGAVFDAHMPTDGVTGPGHAIVPIAFARGADAQPKPTPEPKVSGYWCWAHQDGTVGMCARLEEQCEAARTGFNQTIEGLGDEPAKSECAQQKTAWETASSRPLPTKAMCKMLASKGETCRQVR